MKRKVCPVCGSEARRPWLSFPPTGVARCESCDMRFTDPVASDAALESYYAECFGSGILKDGQALAAKSACGATLALCPASELGRVLDVGSGYGFLLHELRKRGVRSAIGVEPSALSVKYALDELGVDMRRGLLHDAGLEVGTFDTALMMEVVEHLVEPVELLSQVREMLRPGGRLIVGTDNFESAIVREMGVAWPKWIPHLHVSHFDPASLAMVLERAGFAVESSVSYTPWECFVMRRRWKWAGRFAGPVDAGWIERAQRRDAQASLRGRRWRGMVAQAWFRVAMRRDALGSMMFLRARRMD